MMPAATPNFSRHSSGETPHEGRIGIIDIGSNSIRLVVYDGIKRAPLPIFNEKIFCQLGRGLASSGRLHPPGVEAARACIKRFLALVRLMDVVELQVLATAAVRDALDGPAFVEALEREHDISITVISGIKEARLDASGVFSSFYRPAGLAGDLGGGSLELIGLANSHVTGQTTLPIGPLRLLDGGGGDKDHMRRIITEALGGEPWLEDAALPHFYAIGGSFRALAHIHMAMEQYSLEIIHHYTVKQATMRKLLKHVIGLSPSELARLPGVPARRADALLPAALVLEHLLDIAHPVDVVFSASGIREGYLYEKLSPSLRVEDPLIASCTDLASQNGRLPGFARELFQWMTPLTPEESEEEGRLRLAACILSEIAWRIHPEYRAEWAFSRVLHSTLPGISHPERVTLALALYHRYRFKRKHDWDMLHLLGPRDMAWARLVGTAANLACHLSGGMTGNLEQVSLAALGHEVSVTLGAENQDLMSDSVQKRAEGLGETFKAFAKLAK